MFEIERVRGIERAHVALRLLGGWALSAGVFALGGCSAEVPANTETSEMHGLKLGDRGQAVALAHEYFASTGYFENAALRAEYHDWTPVAGPAPLDPNVFGEELQAAVRAFQARASLPTTGVIDDATLALMNTPRCGVPDSFDDGVAPKWAPWAARGWRTDQSVTYRVINLPQTLGRLSRAVVLEFIGFAFETWADDSNLTFEQVTGAADITVDFQNLAGNNTWASTSPAGNVTFNIGGGTAADPFIDWDGTIDTDGIDFFSVAIHEFGHSLGLAHTSIDATFIFDRPVMWPFINRGETLNDLEVDEEEALAVSPYTAWEGVDGGANDVGTSFTGNDLETTWIIGTDPVSNGFSIHRWNQPTNAWVRINGGGVRIDVAGNVAWVVDSNGRAWSKTGVTQNNPNGTGWADRGDINFVDIGTNRGGAVWALGTPQASDGDFSVYRFTSGTSWERVSGDAWRIDVAPDGTPWVVTTEGAIYRRTGVTAAVPSGTAWSRVDGAALDVGISPEGAVWVTGTDERIYLRNVQNGVDNSNPPDGDFNDGSDVPPRNDWVAADGFAVNISVGVDAQPWVVASNSSIWRRR